MNFVYPTFLYALAALAIPIIIHLFNFRKYKTVYFSNVSFLKNVNQETKAKSQLKHILVLLCRMAVIAALVFAFARPFIPILDEGKSDQKVNKSEIAIYLDNSFSMDAEGENGKLIELAKKRAVNIAQAYPPDTRFMLFTNDFESKHQHFVSREQLIQNIEEVTVSPNVIKLSELVSKQKDLLLKSENDEQTKTLSYLISDFQKNISDFQTVENDSSINFVLMPLQGLNVNNLSIDSCWFESPARRLNQSEVLFVKITNNSEEVYRDIPIRLLMNDSLKSLGSFNIDANDSKVVELSFNNTRIGHLKGKIEISDYPITFDNNFYLSYSIAKNIKILSLYQTDNEYKYIQSLFEDDEYIQHSKMSSENIRTNEFKNHDVIVIEDLNEISSGVVSALSAYVSEGGTLVFFPSMSGDKASYNGLLSEFRLPEYQTIDSSKVEINEINYLSALFQNVFKKTDKNVILPQIFKRFVTKLDNYVTYESILKSRGGGEILNSISFNKGKVFAFSTSLDKEDNTIARHPIFVPIIYNAVLYSTTSSKLYYTIGKDDVVEMNSDENSEYPVYHIVNKEHNIDFIPQLLNTKISYKPQLRIKENLKYAGSYTLKTESTELHPISFNYDRSESNIDCHDEISVKKELEKSGLSNFSIVSISGEVAEAGISIINSGKQLWYWFIVIALLFLAIETLIIRLWR